MNHTQKLIHQDQNIVSWSVVNQTSIPLDHPDKIDLRDTNVRILPTVVDGITYAKTRYTDKFYFYAKDVIIGQSIRVYGEYTQLELDLLSQYIDENTIVYDVGGNIGYHTVGFAVRAKHVYSFEPNLKNYKLLEMNTNTLKNVTLIKAAVSDVVGTSHISDYELNDLGNYGECMMSDTGQECSTVMLDKTNLPLPNVMKIDVEGHELKVFLGSKDTIRKSEPVIFYEAMHGSGFDQIYDFLHDELHYNLYWIGVKNYNPKNFNKVNQNIFGEGGVINILATPSRYPVDPYLEKVIDRNDTHVQFIQRIQKRFARG